MWLTKHLSSPQASPREDNRSPRLAPHLGGYLPASGGLRPLPSGSAAPMPMVGLGAAQASLASSVSGISSTGLSHGLGAMGMYSSGSTEVASDLVAAGGSGWYVLQPAPWRRDQ